MKRIERIYEYIHKRSAEYTRKELTGRVGIDAAEIADALAILRNNVSMELNMLYRQDRIIKLSGRPVRFITRQAVEALVGSELPPGPLQSDRIEDCLPRESGQKSPFDRFIGASGSLKKQVEQGKAAILYPPDGLHTLIVGQTGVGKTLFAHMMYEYGCAVGKLQQDAPFVTFNCADYYNNPQLLLAHIFGHIKGAFTGADANKAGLVEAADNGILFLDEIHRLPPEGQEMIFYFMDTGTFNRLGETHRSRKAKVLIIGATTEDPASALTRTFVRRIPNIITIKPLAERDLAEKIDIIKLLLTDEVQRINKPVKMTVEAVKALIGSIGAGNVGQLKSNIKLLCAKAFLNCIDNPAYIEIDFKMMPLNIKNGLLTLSADRQELAQLTDIVSEALFIQPGGVKAKADRADGSAFDLYQIVENKIALLKGEGISNELIKQIVATDVNAYIKSFYNKQDTHMTTRQRLVKIVDSDIVSFSEEISLLVQERLKRPYRDRFLYAFSLHLSAFLKRVRNHAESEAYTEIERAIDEDSPEFKTALEIKEKIEMRYDIRVPRMEVEYFAILLSSVKEDEPEEKVVILVLSHGRSTATSMVDVAQRLFSTNDMNVIAVDMPLEVTPQEIFQKILSDIQTVNYQKGILVLADMGSLCNIGSMLTEQLKVEVKTLDMVSTPLLLEAMRKADIVGMDLNSIYESLLNFKGYEMDLADTKGLREDNEVIVTICSSGEGAAVKLKSLVEDILSQTIERNIEVVPVGVKNMAAVIDELAKTHKIIAAVGMVKPPRNIPYIPLDKLIDGEGETILRSLIKNNVKIVERNQNVVVRKLCEESLEKFLTYLNPHKVISVLIDFESVLERELGRRFNNPIQIRLIVHVGCALERIVVNNSLKYSGDREKMDNRKLAAVEKAARVFQTALKLSLTEDEMCYIADML